MKHKNIIYIFTSIFLIICIVVLSTLITVKNNKKDDYGLILGNLIEEEITLPNCNPRSVLTNTVKLFLILKC